MSHKHGSSLEHTSSEENSCGQGASIRRREFLQLSFAVPFLVPELAERMAGTSKEGQRQASGADPKSKGRMMDANRARSFQPVDRPSPTERRSYFPLESELVSVRGLAYSQGARPGYFDMTPSSQTTVSTSSALKPPEADSERSVWVREDTISLRNLAAWRGRTEPEKAFSQNFPNSVRELITPQGKDYELFPAETGWKNWLDDYPVDDAKKFTIKTAFDVVQFVGQAARNDTAFRAVGSGHSHSEAAAPKEWFTDMKNVEGTMEQPWIWNAGHNFWSQSDINRDHLLRLGAGTILKDLNRNILAPRDLGLPNMGAWDGQTLAGAINTSTHGTGLNLGTFADLVRSVEIICAPESQYQKGTPYARILRIEPSDGITDPEKFVADADSHHMGLIQDDDLFRSVVVGYGCMGVAYAYTLEVRDFYWLREETTLMPWNELKDELSPAGGWEDATEAERAQAVEDFVTRNETRHLQFQVNLAAMQSPEKTMPSDDHQIDGTNPICLIRRHYEVDPEDIPEKPDNWELQVELWSRGTGAATIADDRWPPERRAREIQATIRGFAASGAKFHPFKENKGRAKRLHNQYFHERAESAPFVAQRSKTAWYIALRRLRDEGLFPPKPPPDAATTTELAVPLAELVEAVDAVKDRVDPIKQTKPIPGKNAPAKGQNVFFMAPMGVRFTHESHHFLSAEYRRKTAMLEVPMPVNDGKTRATEEQWVPSLTKDELRDDVAEPALAKLHDMLVKNHHGRPHLGKHNTVHVRADSPDLRPQNMFPEYEKWLDAYRYLNKFGTFDGPFSENKAV